MIIAKIVGGLANQMVIYAAARALAEKNKDQLKLDLTSLGRDPARRFELNKLSMDLQIATDGEIALVKRTLANRTADRVKEKLVRMLGIKRPYVYEEPPVGYDENFFRLSGDVHIKGNFISRRYFEDIEPLLRREFRFRGNLSPRSSEYENSIQSESSVGMHVRRGDYASNENTRRFHGLIGVEYYLEAMKFVETIVDDPKYYVFSDDIEWARDNLRSRNAMKFVDRPNQDDSHEDMYLMSRCRHNIIGNSGFGYWGAWLNANENKTVIAPRRWFANDHFNRIFDLLPPEWTRV